MWWAATADRFLASTSQRLAVAALESFEPNPQAALWMFSAGNLGPGHAWDRRLAALKVDSRWLLALSGGVDSRLLLLAMRPSRTLTRGTATSRDDPTSDAAIAAEVARRHGAENRFFALDAEHVPPETVMQRFCAAGECRIDHLSGYVDGMALWRRLADDRVGGTIRRDHVIGFRPAAHAAGARTYVEAVPLSDLPVPDAWLSSLREAWGEQHEPGGLHRRRGASLSSFADQLTQKYRASVVLSALTQLKTSYVEIANPLLADDVVRASLDLPMRSRRSKQAARSYVASRMPGVPFATRPCLA